jgi:hypothetical protein
LFQQGKQHWGALLKGDWIGFWKTDEEFAESSRELIESGKLDSIVMGMTMPASGAKWLPKGGKIMLGRFGKNLDGLKALAKKYNARILNKAVPKNLTLRYCLRKEIDAATEIHFRLKGVTPDSVSNKIELKYIISKIKLLGKTYFHSSE